MEADPDATVWPVCMWLTLSGKDAYDPDNFEGDLDVHMQKVGTTLAGDTLNGVEYKNWPIVL